MRIDLHAHSTASDGTLSPAELMGAAAAAGLDVVAITDHDTTGGWERAMGALPPGLTLVPGAELSCRWYTPNGSIALHLLAYLFNPADPELSAELARVREHREHRARRIVDLLRADGIDVTWDEILHHAGGGTVGRPHLAQALIRRGLAATVSEAFAPHLLGEKYRLPKHDLDVFAALRLVRDAGGVTVLAHPKAARRGPVVPDELIADMARAGLFGLEADHEDHTPEERAHVRALASDLGLAVTGSSDFHGTNKTVSLGAFTTAPEVYERIVAAAKGYAPVR
ncbi:PHP domain-containing protein [Planosporangium flavigriseum]|uniref:Phosphatase n=1 Tax=Planosporangium flavigriseum TaxID=373681 RepID=A0A8J3LKF0_9ACTN|nr:PHP domain-containing protein [Planosporangium flavigriseum]NJC63582.1 PHP domain-containing protein [Planosporangium flavigriseum]GIG72283.1 phosphatase [Planosporangium flavigriseum]